MSDQHNDGGPAFPSTPSIQFPGAPKGMSLRDWFAGMALAMAGAGALAGVERGHMPPENITEAVATQAFALADAMLAERNAQR